MSYQVNIYNVDNGKRGDEILRYKSLEDFFAEVQEIFEENNKFHGFFQSVWNHYTAMDCVPSSHAIAMAFSYWTARRL